MMDELDLVLLVPADATELIDELNQADAFQADQLEGAGFDGGGDLVTVLLSVTSASLTTLVAILRARWARAKDVTIEVDGMKVTGANPEQIEEILKQLLKARKAKS